VVNRFSADIASIDGIISGMMRSAFDTLVLLIFRIAAVSSIMPVFMLPALLACAIGVVVGEMYTRTAVVLKRLTASSQSPVFSQFGDTLAGLAVIRARAGTASAFTDDLAVKLKIWGATVRANYNCNRWVSVRVDALAAAVSLSAGVLAVAQRGSVAAGLVGFSLSNANGLSQAILHLVRSLNDLEVEMQSVSFAFDPQSMNSC
jgi:ABC-type multidrug transport system fused ATPase/permease subunit